MSDKSRYPAPSGLGIEHATYLRWRRHIPPRHPGFDPGSLSGRFSRQEAARPRIKSGVTERTQGCTAYKLDFALLPTVDHLFELDGTWRLVICAWRTNDAKNDMSHAEFVALCQRVVAHHQLPPPSRA